MNREYAIYAVDFDGTLCESEFPGIGAPNIFLHGERLQEAVDWCKHHGIEFDAVNENLPETLEYFGGTESRKIHADVFIDDKAVNKPKYHVPYKECKV